MGKGNDAQGFSLAFIGGGNMAEAIIRGVTAGGVLPAGNISVTDKSSERREFLRGAFPLARVLEENGAAISGADVVLFAVKPQVMAAVLQEIAPVCHAGQFFISICAGIRSAAIEGGLRTASHPSPRVVRVMPNTPALIGLGMAGICGGANAVEADLELSRKIFDAVGQVVSVKESQMDAVTALSGSGPAYVFYLIESLIEAGIEVGFSAEDARRMVLQMTLGAATLAANSEKSPAELRRAVTSPGGTTAAGVAMLEEKKMREALIECVKAAESRGAELGKA
ncbi:pyrroline-5-carboxylate reductase [soil metagenome]